MKHLYKNIRKYLWGVSLVFCLSSLSCIETIPIDKVEVGKILVLNSLITPNSVFSCKVTKVFPVNDTTDHSIKNATVEIYDETSNELICELEHKTNGYYSSEKYPKVGKSYLIKVSATGYPEVSGVTTIPGKAKANNVSLGIDVGWETLTNWTYSELRFNIEDTVEQENYYEVTCAGFRRTDLDILYNKTDTSTSRVTKIFLDDSINNIEHVHGFADFTIVDPIINSEGLMQYNSSTLVFSDQLFNGLTHAFNIRCYSVTGDAYVFCVYSLSKELYKNRVSLIQHLYERGAKGISRFDDMAGLDFSSKAIDTYSNLTGGYGIFAGYNTTLLFSKLKEQGVIKIDQTQNPYE